MSLPSLTVELAMHIGIGLAIFAAGMFVARGLIGMIASGELRLLWRSVTAMPSILAEDEDRDGIAPRKSESVVYCRSDGQSHLGARRR